MYLEDGKFGKREREEVFLSPRIALHLNREKQFEISKESKSRDRFQLFVSKGKMKGTYLCEEEEKVEEEKKSVCVCVGGVRLADENQLILGKAESHGLSVSLDIFM